MHLKSLCNHGHQAASHRQSDGKQLDESEWKDYEESEFNELPGMDLGGLICFMKSSGKFL